MKRWGLAILIIAFGAVLGMLIEKVAELTLTGQSYLFFTKVYGGLGVHPVSINVTASGVIGLIASYILITRVIKVLT